MALTIVSTAVLLIDIEISLTVQNILQFYNLNCGDYSNIDCRKGIGQLMMVRETVFFVHNKVNDLYYEGRRVEGRG